MGLTAIYPGSFDPITHGHCDIACRAARMVDKLIIAVSAHSNSKKSRMFSPEQRVALAQSALQEFDAELSKKMHVTMFDNLMVNFFNDNKADMVFRGLRATTDFEIEFQMASINRKLNDNMDTMFLTASDKYHFISSSLVREVSALGGDLSKYVSTEVHKALQDKFST